MPAEIVRPFASGRGSWFARPRLCGAAFVCAMMTACASFSAHAQAHETRAGAYVVRASAVDSERFDAASARANGIDPAPTRAVLNFTLLQVEGQRRRNVRGELRASVADLTGRRRSIECGRWSMTAWCPTSATSSSRQGKCSTSGSSPSRKGRRRGPPEISRSDLGARRRVALTAPVPDLGRIRAAAAGLSRPSMANWNKSGSRPGRSLRVAAGLLIVVAVAPLLRTSSKARRSGSSQAPRRRGAGRLDPPRHRAAR